MFMLRFRSRNVLGREFVGLLRQSRRHLVQVSGKRAQRRQRGRKRREGTVIRRHGYAHASAQYANQSAWGHPHSHGERNSGVLQEWVLAESGTDVGSRFHALLAGGFRESSRRCSTG